MISGPHSAPWTGLGRLQGDVSRLEHSKADRHEVSAFNERMARLECSVREARSEIDGLRNELRELQDRRYAD